MSYHLAFYFPPIHKCPGLREAVIEGARLHGDLVEIDEQEGAPVRDVDGCIFYGIVGEHKKPLFDAYRKAGKITVFVDKGYIRDPGSKYVRVAVNAFQPLAYLQTKIRPSDRFSRLGIALQPYSYRPEGPILFDGASEKFCMWHGLDFAHWGRKTTTRIWRHSSAQVIYRPRPIHSHAGLPPLDDELRRARLVVSYGGNIGWDSVVAGVPHFAIGDSVARPISETDWTRVGTPYIPSEAERHQWCCDVAYCQFTVAEFASGEAWGHIREQFA